MLKDIISISTGFQSSINIEYDFNDESKISGFIPTTSALNVIDNIISNTENDSTERAKILTGAYGRGKSHIVLVSMAILYNKDISTFKKLIKNIRKLNSDVASRIENYISGSKRLLPIIVNGNSGNLSHSFLLALQQALKNYDLEDITPETHFTAVLDTINRWKEDYPETYERFLSLIQVKEETFLKKISLHDEETYQLFTQLHPQLTSGAVFNPFVNTNVVDVFDKVNTALKAKGYSGMYVVYDEFGKYLETNISHTTESEMKLLQDFAEKCNRESSQQLHLMLICHKDISNYIDDGLPKDKVDGWRGISGRFEHITLSNNFHQMYEIISATINKKKKLWADFCKTNESIFSEILNTAQKSNYLSGKDELVTYDCYPLHPTTTFLLPRLSERIAQNERTLFTFLTSMQKNTLREFIVSSEEDFPVVTPDYLYDYFEQELRKELSSSEMHKIYTLAARLLNQLEPNSLDAQIVKTIAIVYCVQQFERVAPTVETICNIFCVRYDRKQITQKIDELINQKYIVYRKNSNSFLCLKESSGTDINHEIKNKVDQLSNELDFETALNLCAENNYLYPVKHNETKCITRYFEFRFIRYQNLKKGIFNPVRQGASGCVYAVIFESESELEKALRSKKINGADDRCVLILPKYYTVIRSSIYSYLAAKELRDNCGEEDNILRTEYDLITEDLETVVSRFIMQYTKPEMGGSIYYYKSKPVNITRKSKLTELLSNICDTVYPHTPIINNESINKDKLPGVAITSRTKLVTAILENSDLQNNMGLTGTGQDVSFMRSTLIQTCIIAPKEDGSLAISIDTAEESIRYVLMEIHNFLTSTAQLGERSFAELYDILINYKNGIGMKKGAIPVFIAVVLRSMKKDLVIKSGNYEVKINADTLNSVNERPEVYSVLMENWDQDKMDYLSTLEEMFAEFIIDKERTMNSFAYITGAIDRWYLSLPKCAKEMKKKYSNGKTINKKHHNFYSVLRLSKTNARDFLMVQVPKAFESESVGSTISDQVRDCKSELDGAKSDLTDRIIREVSNLFGENKDASLKTILTDWYGSLSKSTTQHLFINNENSILNMIATVANDEITFAERIAKAVSGLRIDDWSNAILDDFVGTLKRFKETIEEYDSQAEQHIEEKGRQYKIVTMDSNGEEIVKSFDRIGYSRRAELLYRDITGAIADMGQSITEQEKRQVLFEILESLC